MTNVELAAYLNTELSLTDAVAVTPAVIRQWVLWDVLPKAAGRGRGRGRGINWHRSERDLKRARQLATLRSAGVRRENALVVHAYVAWGHPDWERVREALVFELALATAAIRKRITTDLQFGPFAYVSKARKRAFRTQLGPLDYRLKGSAFELDAELYALAGQAAFHPELMELEQLNRLSNLIGERMPFPKQLSVVLSRVLVEAFVGLFALEDETNKAMITSVPQVSEVEFRRARILLKRLLEFHRTGIGPFVVPSVVVNLMAKLSELGPQITMGHWLIAAFAATLRLGQREIPDFAIFGINPELLSELKPDSL